MKLAFSVNFPWGTTPPACDFGKIRSPVRAPGRSEGDGHVEYLMVYRADGSAACVGLERVVGRVAGKVGTFVLQRVGTFEGGQAKKHIQSSRAPQRESFGTCAGRELRPWGTARSIRSC